MNDGKALLAAVCEHPDDDTHRLVYADWLEDNGDPQRGEFIRGQIELLRLDPEDERLPVLAARARELEAANYKRWKRELPRWASLKYEHAVSDMVALPDHLPSSLFHRGFPVVIDCVPPEWRRHAHKALLRAPIQGVHFIGAMEYINDLLEMETHHLEPLRAINVGETGIHGEGLEGFITRPALVNLRVLIAYLNDLGGSDISLLANAPNLTELTVLDLWGNDFGPDGAKALAKSKSWRKIEVLTISHNAMRDEGVKALARSALLASVRDLDLGGNDLTGEGMKALAKSKHLDCLEELYLGFNAIDGLAPALVDAVGFQRLVSLDLQGNPLGPTGGAALARAPFHRLRKLHLLDCQIDATGAEALAGNTTLAELRELDLSGNEVGTRAAAAIAAAPHFANLRKLDLGGGNIGDEGAAALARSAVLGRVESLDLSGNAICDAGALALAASTTLKSLRELWLGGNRIGGAAAAALANAAWAGRLEALYIRDNPMSREGRRELKRRLGSRVWC